MFNLPEERRTHNTRTTTILDSWSSDHGKSLRGVEDSLRWASIFTCLSTRAIHIEVVKEMTSSSFLNALKRFIAIRGNVNIFRSDRGTNFVGAVRKLNVTAINVEDGTVIIILL